MAIERRWVPVFGAFTVLVGGVLANLAAAKPFWNDEIYTILIASLPLGKLWPATKDGMDLMPPLNSLLTHAIDATIGVGRVSTRLPALVGFWATALVVFDLVRRRSHVIAALSAALLLCFTEAFRYATEARGYSLMVGFFAVALWAWSEAARERNRRLTVPLLGAALAAGLWTQYFGIFAFVPVAAGEAVRFARTRKVDRGIATAAALAVVAALPLRVLMPAAAARAATFWSRAALSDVVPLYTLLFAPLLSRAVLMALGLGVLLGAASAAAGRRAPLRCSYEDLPAYELAAGVAAFAVPLGTVLLGVYVTGTLVPRYALGGVVAVSIALPLMVARMRSRRRAADLVLCTTLLAVFCASALGGVVHAATTDRDPAAARPLLARDLANGDTVVVSATTEYLQLWYYTSPALRDRLVYLADPAAAVRQLGNDTLDRDYLAIRRWTPVPVVDYDAFVATHRSFQLYDLGTGWVARRLRQEGHRLDEVGREQNATMYAVELAR